MTCLIEVKQTLLMLAPSGSFQLLPPGHSDQDFLKITAVTAGASKKQPSKQPFHLR